MRPRIRACDVFNINKLFSPHSTVQGLALMSPVRVGMLKVCEPKGNTPLTRTVALAFVRQLRIIDATPGRNGPGRVYRVKILLVTGVTEKNLALWGVDELRVRDPMMDKVYIAYNCVLKPGEIHAHVRM